MPTDATTPDLDKIALIVNDRELDLWTSVTVSDDFLQPCQTAQFTLAADETRLDVLQGLMPGQDCQVRVNGVPIMTGYLDSVSLDSGRSGTILNVTARDRLSLLVDGNVNPNMPLAPKMTLKQLCEAIIRDQFGLDLRILDDPGEQKLARDRGVGRPVASVAAQKRYKRKPKDLLKSVRPQPNEGAFQYLARIIQREGLHLWCSAEGDAILGGPDYEQEPAYDLTNRIGRDGGANNILTARVRRDQTGVPSHIWVSGKSSKPGEKASPKGHATYPAQGLFKPFYVVDDQSDDRDHADIVAQFVLAKAVLKSFAYDVKVRGLSDPASSAVYQVNTMANVTDERCLLDGPMWVSKRTFHKGRDGTTTDLTLIPADRFLWALATDAPPPPVPKTYGDARAAAKGKPSTDKPAQAVAPAWFPLAVDISDSLKAR
jgi:prophage tail gpP-like protein